MQKKVKLTLQFSLAQALLAAAGWLLSVMSYLGQTGATYSTGDEQGNMACGIPIFIRESWFEATAVLFGLPIGVIVGAVYGLRYLATKKNNTVGA